MLVCPKCKSSEHITKLDYVDPNTELYVGQREPEWGDLYCGICELYVEKFLEIDDADADYLPVGWE